VYVFVVLADRKAARVRY